MTINSLSQLNEHYQDIVTDFYSFLPEEFRGLFSKDAGYHRKRYLDLLNRTYGKNVVELGSDKPFITHCLKMIHADSTFHTISMDIPHSPYPILRVDIESEVFPFQDESVDDVIFTEVLEHLFRDPSWAVFQMNRVLKPGGTLFLTTPNACGYDVLQNIIQQKNPNERNQFYARMESGHPHLWTAHELTLLLESHGFSIKEITTVDYYEVPCHPAVTELINTYSVNKELHGQALRIEAKRTERCTEAQYPLELFPNGVPVQKIGALSCWADAPNQ